MSARRTEVSAARGQTKLWKKWAVDASAFEPGSISTSRSEVLNRGMHPSTPLRAADTGRPRVAAADTRGQRSRVRQPSANNRAPPALAAMAPPRSVASRMCTLISIVGLLLMSLLMRLAVLREVAVYTHDKVGSWAGRYI